MEFFDVIKNASQIASSILIIFTFSATVFKPIRNRVVDYIRGTVNQGSTEKLLSEIKTTLETHIEKDKDKQAVFDMQAKALTCLLRNNIIDIYYEYYEKGKIPAYQRENMIRQYELYSAMGGNSYVSIIYKDMLELPIDNGSW